MVHNLFVQQQYTFLVEQTASLMSSCCNYVRSNCGVSHFSLERVPEMLLTYLT